MHYHSPERTGPIAPCWCPSFVESHRRLKEVDFQFYERCRVPVCLTEVALDETVVKIVPRPSSTLHIATLQEPALPSYGVYSPLPEVATPCIDIQWDMKNTAWRVKAQELRQYPSWHMATRN